MPRYTAGALRARKKFVWGVGTDWNEVSTKPVRTFFGLQRKKKALLLFVLKFLQARIPSWTERVFFAEFDPHATWFDELKPGFGDKEFFFEEGYRKSRNERTRDRQDSWNGDFCEIGNRNSYGIRPDHHGKGYSHYSHTRPLVVVRQIDGGQLAP